MATHAMANAFISFIHEEQQVAIAVRNLLRDKVGNEHDVFLSADNWQMRAGENWFERIREELDRARVVILLLSPNSISRPWINFEAGAGWLARKSIIPVCFGRLQRGNLPKPYSDLQALDLRAQYYELVRDALHWLTEGRVLPPVPFPPWDAMVAALYEELDRLPENH